MLRTEMSSILDLSLQPRPCYVTLQLLPLGSGAYFPTRGIRAGLGLVWAALGKRWWLALGLDFRSPCVFLLFLSEPCHHRVSRALDSERHGPITPST